MSNSPEIDRSFDEDYEVLEARCKRNDVVLEGYKLIAGLSDPDPFKVQAEVMKRLLEAEIDYKALLEWAVMAYETTKDKLGPYHFKSQVLWSTAPQAIKERAK